jgi:SAM-dependent methyltransferase
VYGYDVSPDAYDLVPYTEHAFAETHPDRLRVIAALSGWAPPSSLAPRVLELGCGRGGNLLPLAESWPEASFVGIDLSAGQINDARHVAEAAALKNVHFVARDFAEPPRSEAEEVDFVVCHGVYSWVTKTQRGVLLERIRQALRADGVAYVSFNVLPGWYRRLAARDLLRLSAKKGLFPGPREALAWLADVTPPEPHLRPYKEDLRAVHERLSATESAYLTHEYLAEEHHPVGVGTFLEECHAHGLTYLGDSLPSETAFDLLPKAAQEKSNALPFEDALALSDFVRGTAFRRALLVREDTALARGFGARRDLDPAPLREMRVRSRLVPSGGAEGGAETFHGSGTSLVLAGLATRALRVLADIAPRSIAIEALAGSLQVEMETLGRELLDLSTASSGVDFSFREPAFVTHCTEQPRALAVARWHAHAPEGPVTNVWHEEVALEPIGRFLLARLDGQTSRQKLASSVVQSARDGARVSEAEALAVVDASLAALAEAALLVG